MASRSSFAKHVLTVSFMVSSVTLLIPTGAEAKERTVCGDGVCEIPGYPVEDATRCPEDCAFPPPPPPPPPPPAPVLPADLRGQTDCPWGSWDCNPPLTAASAVTQINDLFDGGSGQLTHLLHETWPQTDLDLSWHWQSIQRVPYGANARYFAATNSLSNNSGRLHVFHLGEEAHTTDPFFGGNGERDSNLQVTALTADPSTSSLKYNHAGGAQMLGKLLGIGLECHGGQSICSGRNAGVAFWDLSTPWSPMARGMLEVQYTNAGTVSLAKLHDGKYLLIVGEADAARLNFYTSPSPFSSWTKVDTWSTSTDTVFTTIGDDDWGAYQNLELVVDGTENGRLYLVATHNHGLFIHGEDWVDLYRLESADGQARLTKVAKRHIHCEDSCNLDAGSGVYVTPGGRLVLYGIEHYPDGCNDDCSRMAEFPF